MSLKTEILKVAETGLAFTPAGLCGLNPGLGTEREIADAYSELLAEGRLDRQPRGMVGITRAIDKANKSFRDAGDNLWN